MKEHLKYILLKVYWEHEISRQDIIDRFGIATAQSANYFSEVKKNYPNAIKYNDSLKRYVPGHAIERYLPSKDFQHYLSTVKSGEMYTVNILSIKPYIPVELYRVLHKAINGKFAIRFKYHSLNNTSKQGSRTVYPHSLINSGYRWHFRGWERESQIFKDFNLSRIILESVELIKEKNEMSGIGFDQAWNNELSVFLIPNPALNDAKKSIVSMDFNMRDGILDVFCKQALLLYTLNSYLVTEFSTKPPPTQLLAIGNIDYLKKYLPVNTSL